MFKDFYLILNELQHSFHSVLFHRINFNLHLINYKANSLLFWEILLFFFLFVSVRAIHDYVINNFVIFFAFISTPMAEWFTVGVKKRFSRSFLHTLIYVLPARTSIDHCYVIVFVFKNNYFRNILM